MKTNIVFFQELIIIECFLFNFQTTQSALDKLQPLMQVFAWLYD